MQTGNSERRRVVVTGMGVVSSLGDSPAALHEALARGDSGLKSIEVFKLNGLGPREAGEIPSFSPEDYLGRVNLRPLDRTARLVTVAVHLAFEAAGWTRDLRREQPVGLVVGTMYGSVHTISSFDRRAQVAGPKYAKPFDFANSVINAAAGQTAIWHGLTGMNTTVAGGTTAGLQALAYAAEAIRTGRADTVCAGGVDELCFESFSGFDQAGLLCSGRNGHSRGDSRGEPCSVPFDARRNGLALGEGAGFLILEEAGVAADRGVPILAEIRGHGNCYDVSRGREAERSVAAIRRAIHIALQDADIDPGDIDAVSSAANGSVEGDRHEALGLAASLGETVPITAVKSMLGETLGASGSLATIALIEAMRTGVLPGIRGLERLEEGLALGGSRRESRKIPMRRGLVTAVGLDGNVATLVVEGEA